jgi:flagellar hook-associated protein 3 FlgL
MAGLYPIPSTRTSTLLTQNRLTSQMFSDQVAMARLQAQISTGIRLTAPSDDAPAAVRGIALQRLLELKDQHQVNLKTSQSFLDATDTSVNSVSDLLLRIRSTVQGSIGVLATDQDREAAVVEIEGAMQQLLSVANQKFRDRYLFAGSRDSTIPFVFDGNTVRYDGNEGNLQSYTDTDLLTATNVPGSDIFGAISAQVLGNTDLTPITSRDTLLADLRGGQGISDGRIAISDGTSTSIVDLSGAETLGDVADLIAANPPAGRRLTARVTSQGLFIDIDDGPNTNLTIREVSSGTTAGELGILATFSAGNGPIIGNDLDPKMSLSTRLDQILGVKATALLNSDGPNNGILVEAKLPGAGDNGVAIHYVDDSKLHASPGLTAGNETVTYSTVPVAARASLAFSGFNNNLLLTANAAGTDLNNVEIEIVDGGAIGNNADIVYDGVLKKLTIAIDNTGLTTVQRVITMVNADGHFTATYDASNPADGGFVGTAAIPITDAGVISGNTSNSGGDANTIFVNIQPGATTANQVVAALQANAQVAAQFDASLDDSDSTSPAFVGTGFVEVAATSLTEGGSGTSLDQSSGLQIISRGQTFTVDLSTAETVEDVLNAINTSGAGVLAQINETGTAINVRARVSGTDFSIGENGGSTATQLGIRSISLTTPLSQLNHGRGVIQAVGDDFTIARADGTSFTVDIDAALTVGNVLDLINTNAGNLNPANQVIARLALTGNGIELVDGSSGAGQLQVQATFGSHAAIDLGLVAAGQTTSSPPAAGNSATAGIAFPSPNDLNTAFQVTAVSGGSQLNGVNIVFANSLVGDVATATYSSALNQLTIDLDSSATTTNTILAAIQAEGTFTAILDTSADPTNDGSGIPNATGTVGTTSGGTAAVLTGTEINPQEVEGVFNTLLRLAAALETNNEQDIERGMALLDIDFDRIVHSRAEVGFRGRNLEALKSRIDDETNQVKDALSKEIDTDYAAAIAGLTSRQAAYEASLRLTAQLSQITLLNFL